MAFTPLNALNAFVAVSRRLSYTKAARELGISTSALSQSVRQLEERLDVTLLLRTSRCVSLTDAGQRLLDQAGPALDQALESLKTVDAKADVVTGRVRVAVPSALVTLLLGRVLPVFAAAHPRAEVDVHVDEDTAGAMAEGIDARVRLSETIRHDIMQVRLAAPTRFVVVGAPSYLARRGAPKHPTDLLDHDCIGLRRATGGDPWPWPLEQGTKTWKVRVRGPVTTTDFELMRVLAVAGLGLHHGLEPTVAADVARGDLELVLDEFALAVPGLFLSFRRRSQVSTALRAFVRVARAELSRVPPW